MESKLIKDWKGSDVQRMRNIIRKQYNDSTRSQIGYRKKKKIMLKVKYGRKKVNNGL